MLNWMEVFRILRRGDLWMHVGCYKTSSLPPFLPWSSTLSGELYLGLLIGSLQETFKRKSCQESVSKNFFFFFFVGPILELFKLRFCCFFFCVQTFSLSAAGGEADEGRRRLFRCLWCVIFPQPVFAPRASH